MSFKNASNQFYLRNEFDFFAEKQGDSTTDLIPLIMKTPMDDMEIQNVIDLLLTKQIGTSAPVNHDWVEASEKNETKQLQRQLAEKETLLADEVAKSKSLTDRMNVLRYAICDFSFYPTMYFNFTIFF